jgi:cytochrome P450
MFFAFTNYMRELIEEKRKDRQDDLVSALLDVQVDGEALSEPELIHFCMTLPGAGFETTEHLIGNILLCLDEYPDAREQVWANPSLLPSTIDTSLRSVVSISKKPCRSSRACLACLTHTQ